MLKNNKIFNFKMQSTLFRKNNLLVCNHKFISVVCIFLGVYAQFA